MHLYKSPITGTLVLTILSVAAAAPSARAAAPLPANVWADLAGGDETARNRAAAALQAAPPEMVVAYLRERLQPVNAESNRIDRLIEELDSNKFAIRCRAMEELEYLGELAQPQLTKALANKPPLEVCRRIEQLLSRFQPVQMMVTREVLRQSLKPAISEPQIDRLLRNSPKEPQPQLATQDKQPQIDRLLRNPPNGNPNNLLLIDRRCSTVTPNGLHEMDVTEQLQLVPAPPSPLWVRAERAVAVLERIGSKEAREVLKTLANGEAAAAPTRAAKEALARLEQTAAR